MGLNSVVQTALTGLNAAAVQLQVSAHNVANLSTPGFKQSQLRLATLPSHTVFGGGTNALQIGRGVRTAAIDVDFSQGPIVQENQPALLALEGDGLFMLEGNDGERLYTRAGRFHLSSAGELVAAGGERLLGLAADSAGQLDNGQLTPLQIRLGSQVAGANGRGATLRSFSVSRNGRIIGQYSDGRGRTLGQLRLARFANPAGLVQRGSSTLRATSAAGLPRESDPGENGAAEVIAGATELSNVDLGRQLIDLTLAGNQFRANLAVLQTADTLLAELFFPYRR